MDYSRISDMKPVEGMKIVDYLQKVKQIKLPEHYYVQYNVKYAESAKINYYVQDKVNGLTIEYDVPERDTSKPPKKVKLIIAKQLNSIGNPEETKEKLNMFLKSSSKYSTKEAIVPIGYMAELQKLGWTFTPEGMEFMQVTKADGTVQIRRTEFTGAEIDSFSNEQIEANKKEHIARTEENLIEMMEDYIINVYEELPENLSEERKRYKEKVKKYASNKKAGIKNSTDLLDAIMKQMKPIKENTTLIPLMQKIYNENIEMYLDMMPDVYRHIDGDVTWHKYFTDYMRVRETAVKEREQNNNELPENSIAEVMMEKLVADIDAKKEKEAEARREDIKKKMNRRLGIKEEKGDEPGSVEIA